MIADRSLLKEALDELVRLKTEMNDPTRLLAQLYVSALDDWAGRLRLEPAELDKLVLIQESAATPQLH